MNKSEGCAVDTLEQLLWELYGRFEQDRKPRRVQLRNLRQLIAQYEEDPPERTPEQISQMDQLKVALYLERTGGPIPPPLPSAEVPWVWQGAPDPESGPDTVRVGDGYYRVHDLAAAVMSIHELSRPCSEPGCPRLVRGDADHCSAHRVVAIKTERLS